MHGSIGHECVDRRHPHRLTAEVQALGTLGVAIFNAGNAVRGTPLEITPEQFESTWRGSTYAGFLFARATLPLLLAADAIADTYWQLHQQHRSAWTHELDLRPYKEAF